ncbi:MAG: GGDEF domain-containing protein [Sulfuricurvum sp.]
MKNTKTFWTLALSTGGMIVLIGAAILFLFRYVGYQGADTRAQMSAELVRESLTSHMKAGSADYQNELLEQIASIEGVRSAWVVRGESIVRQYGKGLHPQEPKDEIDRMVLREGKSYHDITGTIFSDTLYRLSIPYVAQENGKIDCMSCHEAKNGEILGVVSIEMEMNDIKGSGILAAAAASTMLVLLGVLTLRNVRRFVASYKEPLDRIAEAMEKAEGGDYGHRIEAPEGKDGYSAVMWTNAILEKLDTTLNESGEKIGAMIRIDQPKNDPMYTLHVGISQLYEIDRFRASIEKDGNLAEVYERLVALIRMRWGLNDFNLFEMNPMTKFTRLVHSEKTLLCDAVNSGCRADRTSGIIDSTECEAACPKMIDPAAQYACRSYPVADDLDIVISIVTQDARELPKIRSVLEQLGNYISASRLQIINRKLEESVRIDPLTGLYNRKFLEEFAALIVAQSKRTAIPYGVLIVDMDGFHSINQAYDVQVGNEVIKAIGRNIQDLTRPGDMVIRYGIDTFAVVLYDYEHDETEQVAEAIRASFKKKIRVNTYAILKTVSIGMAVFPAQTGDMKEAIEFAKRALLEAKHRGGNCVVSFDPKSMPL